MEKSVAQIALFAALIAVLGLVPPINMGFGVPITAQGLGVMLCGTVLGAKRGTLAVLLFLLIVALGLPLLAGGRGGLGQFVGPTAGFLFGFPVAAYVAGLLTEKLRNIPLGFAAGIGAIIGGVAALYPMGILGFSLVTGRSIADSTAVMAVFIPGDILKAVIAGVLTASLAKARPSIVASRSR